VGRKKVIADFDSGRITFDGGVMLLAAAERWLGIGNRLAGPIADPRNLVVVMHSIAGILRPPLPFHPLCARNLWQLRPHARHCLRLRRPRKSSQAAPTILVRRAT